jgi:hypothetical protein
LICYLLNYYNVKKKILWHRVDDWFWKKKKNLLFIKKLKIKALKLKVMGKCSFFYIALFIQRLLGKNCIAIFILIFLVWNLYIFVEKNYWKRKKLLKNKTGEKKWLLVHILKKIKKCHECYYILFWDECYWSVFWLYILPGKYIGLRNDFFQFNCVFFY